MPGVDMAGSNGMHAMPGADTIGELLRAPCGGDTRLWTGRAAPVLDISVALRGTVPRATSPPVVTAGALHMGIGRGTPSNTSAPTTAVRRGSGSFHLPDGSFDHQGMGGRLAPPGSQHGGNASSNARARTQAKPGAPPRHPHQQGGANEEPAGEGLEQTPAGDPGRATGNKNGSIRRQPHGRLGSTGPGAAVAPDDAVEEHANEAGSMGGAATAHGRSNGGASGRRSGGGAKAHASGGGAKPGGKAANGAPNAAVPKGLKGGSPKRTRLLSGLGDGPGGGGGGLLSASGTLLAPPGGSALLTSHSLPTPLPSDLRSPKPSGER